MTFEAQNGAWTPVETQIFEDILETAQNKWSDICGVPLGSCWVSCKRKETPKRRIGENEERINRNTCSLQVSKVTKIANQQFSVNKQMPRMHEATSGSKEPMPNVSVIVKTC